MKFRATCVAVLTSVLMAHADATPWFNGGIASGFPAATTLSGGSWGALPSDSTAVWENGAVAMDIAEDQVYSFTATEPTPTHHTKIVYTLSLAFEAAYDTLPEVPNDAKIGVIAYSDGSQAVYAFLQKDSTDTTKSSWSVSDIAVADLATPTVIEVTVDSEDGANVTASYKVGNNAAVKLAIVGVPELQVVDFRGMGRCAALSATIDGKAAIAEVDDTPYYYRNAVVSAAVVASTTSPLPLLKLLSDFGDVTIDKGNSCKVEYGSYSFNAVTASDAMITRADGGEGVVIYSSVASAGNVPGEDVVIPISQAFVDASGISGDVQAAFTSTAKQSNGLTVKQSYLIGLPSATTAFKQKVDKPTTSGIKVSFSGLSIPQNSPVKFGLSKNGAAPTDELPNPEVTIDKSTDATGKYMLKAKVDGAWIDSGVVLGVQKVATTAATSYIPVQWKDLENDGNIKPTDLVDASDLTKGDQLEVFDPNTDTFETYVLQEGGSWQFVSPAGGAKTAPTITTVQRGQAIKLTQSEEKRKENLYTLGKHEEGPVTTSLVAGKINLVANPNNAPFSDFDKIGRSNKVYINDSLSAIPEVMYRYVDGVGWQKKTLKDNKWVWEDAGSIPAGKGFFLDNQGSKASIAW